MAFICGILSFLCVVYYGVIVVYSGPDTSFSAIWLVLALLLIIAATVAFAFEIRLSLHALGLAVEHMPRGDALKKRLEEASK